MRVSIMLVLICLLCTACSAEKEHPSVSESPPPLVVIEESEIREVVEAMEEVPFEAAPEAVLEGSVSMKPEPSIKRQKPWAEVGSFICYYGEFNQDMGLYDVAILESVQFTPDRITWLRSHGTYTIAYISVGEAHNLEVGDGLGPGGYASYFIDDNGEPAKNKNWNSYFVDAGSEAWQERILEEAGRILEMGCDGLFMDTIDTAEAFPETRAGMAELIRRLRETYPDIKLVANRGMFMLSDFAPYISGMMFEDFTGGYDFNRQQYKMNNDNDLKWTAAEADKINKVRKDYYFPVFALDYTDPADEDSIQICYDRAWEYDFIPNVSVIRLDRVTWHGITPTTQRGVKSGLPLRYETDGVSADTTNADASTNVNAENLFTQYYDEYDGAFMSPLKGFRANHFPLKNYETLVHVNLAWDELESDVSDGVEKILAVCEEKWKGISFTSTRVIPRVYLDYPSTTPDDSKELIPAYGRDYYVERHWPSDMETGDYSSPQFIVRLEKLIAKLGEAWDNDPRVAYVETGLIGFWGEQHMPEISPQMQQIMGDAFNKAFKNKKVMVRRPQDFKDYSFGIYWDSFAHMDEMYMYYGIRALGDRWKTQPIGGETAYDWGNYQIQPGDNPNDTLRDPAHRINLINTIREVHANHIGWVSDYDSFDKEVAVGAAEVQKALGYRFVIREAQYTPAVNDVLSVSIRVENTGSSPFYYDWPIEFSLVKDGKMVYRHRQQGFALSSVMPGDDWNADTQSYQIAPKLYEIADQFSVSGLENGDYMLCVAIVDPDGNMPNPRFANESYTVFGRTALGWIGIGGAPTKQGLEGYALKSIAEDDVMYMNR